MWKWKYGAPQARPVKRKMAAMAQMRPSASQAIGRDTSSLGIRTAFVPGNPTGCASEAGARVAEAPELPHLRANRLVHGILLRPGGQAADEADEAPGSQQVRRAVERQQHHELETEE